MVRHCVLFCLLLFPVSLFAGEFTATVSRKDVAVGESLALTLTLTNATAKSAPSLSHLKKVLTIHSQQQSSNTVITNGKMTTSTSWQFTLIPEKEGEVTIPSIRIETSEGPLFTRPIRLNVSRHASATGVSEGRGLTLTSKASKANPYKYEPFLYTVKLVSKHDLANLNISQITLEDAIVERIGEEQVENMIVDGERVAVIEINYLITPLKPGPLVIPSIAIRGAFPVKRKFRLGSFFDEDPFQIMRHFDRLEPFSLSTDEITLDVQPPVPDVHPWLPAANIKIEEEWEAPNPVKVGEPLNRKIQIIAEGIKASQLPSLQEGQADKKDFALYADKPEMKDNRINGRLRSTRKEQYTLIPQQAGTARLPEIAIAWWDTVNHKKAYAVVPAREVEVLPAPDASKNESPLEPSPSQKAEVVVIEKRDNTLLLAIIAAMGLLLLFLSFWGIALNKKIARLTQSPEKKAAKKPQKPLLSKLQSIHSPKQLHESLNAYAHTHWDISSNATLSTIFHAMRLHTSPDKHEEISSLEKELEGGLYRNQDIDLSDIAHRCEKILKQAAKKGAQLSDKKESLPELNPR